MKINQFKKLLGLMMIACALVFIPFNPTGVIAITDNNWSLEKEISTDQSQWYEDLGEVIVGTDLFYRITLNNYTGLELNYSLDDNMFGSFTGTLQSGAGDQFFNYGPFPALLGYHANIVTGTVYPYTPGFTSTISPTSITAYASYTGISSAVPEPVTLLLIGFGILGLAGLRKKLKR